MLHSRRCQPFFKAAFPAFSQGQLHFLSVPCPQANFCTRQVLPLDKSCLSGDLVLDKSCHIVISAAHIVFFFYYSTWMGGSSIFSGKAASISSISVIAPPTEEEKERKRKRKRISVIAPTTGQRTCVSGYLRTYETHAPEEAAGDLEVD